MTALSDSDMQALLQNFLHLSSEEQLKLIKYVKNLEAKEPERMAALREFVNFEEPEQEVVEIIEIIDDDECELSAQPDNCAEISMEIDSEEEDTCRQLFTNPTDSSSNEQPKEPVQEATTHEKQSALVETSNNAEMSALTKSSSFANILKGVNFENIAQILETAQNIELPACINNSFQDDASDIATIDEATIKTNCTFINH